LTITSLLAATIFIAAYGLIISERVHRTIVALVGAMVMVLCGMLTQAEAFHHIDFNTIGLLIGMMVIVNITGETGLFNYLSIWAAKKVKAEPVALLIALSTLTMISSALLDNVTTVLLTVPVTFSITSQLKLDVKPFLIAQILSSNIGGTATLVGDPPNIMIGSAVGLDYMAFVTNLAGISLVIYVITMFLLVVWYRKDLHTLPELQAQVMRLEARKQISRPALLKKCLAVLLLTMLLFLLHSVIGVETATAALTGAALLLLITCPRDETVIANVLAKVEWTAIFFFAGLFVLVGALVEVGIINSLAAAAMELTQGDSSATALLILWMSALASGFVDNIPFVATMIPLIQDMGNMGMTNLNALWWSLALGACLGGNGTLIGSSANVVVASMAAQRGQQISFLGFMKLAFPMMLLSIVISSVYVYVRYL
jgi:Na+/H+ antiporter NhaD/arsenite permease-like protein